MHWDELQSTVIILQTDLQILLFLNTISNKIVNENKTLNKHLLDITNNRMDSTKLNYEND